MLPTPSTSHVDLERVYDPAEDSFLLIDTLSSPAETDFLQRRFGNHQHDEKGHSRAVPLLLEIGLGSGVILAFLSANSDKLFGTNEILAIGTDVNHFACQAARTTVLKACADREFEEASVKTPRQKSATFLGAVNADLGSCFRTGSVDVLIFNPPYVPSSQLPRLPNSESLETHPSSFERDSHLLELSYAGGKDGMEVTNRLLSHLPDLLNSRYGVAYILLCRQNEPEKVMDRVRSWGPEWTAQVVGSSGKQAGWEKLQVVRIMRGLKPL